MIPAAVSILFGAAFTVAVSFALGKLMLQRRPLPLEAGEERWLAFLTGSAALSTLVFALCAGGLARAGVFLFVGGAILAEAWFRRARGSAGKEAAGLPKLWRWLCGAGFATYFCLYFFNAMAPEISPDGTAYHLGLVARYLRDHGFVRNTTNIYASMPGGAEMLFLFAFAFGRHSAAALVHFSFLCALAWGMLLYGRRMGARVAGVCGALFVVATPVVGIDGASAYNDVALACATFGVFYLLEIWDSLPAPSPRIAFVAGVAAGFAYALKYTGAVAVLYALGFLAWRSRRRGGAVGPTLLAAAAGALLVALPWMVKNWLWVHNPFSPFANALFPNPFVHALFEQDYTRQLRDPAYYGLRSATEIPWALTVKGSLTGILGPLYLLAPVALFALRKPAGRRLLLAAAVFAAPYAGNLGCRFLIPALPFVALALALVVTRVPALAAALVILHGWVSWPDILNRYYPPSNFHLRKVPVAQALRIKSEEEYLTAGVDTYAQARLIERQVPPGRKVLSLDPLAEAYTTREILVAYQSAFNETARDILFVALNPEYAPTRWAELRFEARRFRRMRVQTAGVHEVRFFYAGTELPRAPNWRLHASRNPWDVQMAFDNSPVTRWRTWDRQRTEAYLEVDFGAPRVVDTVRVERSPDQSGVAPRLQVEGQPVQTRLEERTAPLPPRLREAATRELKARGIDYLLVRDEQEVAEDFYVNRAAWKMTEIGQAGGARLYRFD